MMKRLTLTLAIILAGIGAQATEAKILLYGYVIEGNVDELFAQKQKKQAPTFMKDVRIQVFENDSVVRDFTNRNSGFYALVLEAGKDYEVSFSHSGHIEKRVFIEGAQIPDKEYEQAFKMFTDITLFPKIENVNTDEYGSKVIARCVFNEGKERMMWDMPYAQNAFNEFIEMAGIKPGEE